MDVVFAKSTTSVGGPHGMTYDLVAGRAYSADHPAVLSRPELFADSPTWAQTRNGYVEVVEQATAAPGEKRRGK